VRRRRAVSTAAGSGIAAGVLVVIGAIVLISMSGGGGDDDGYRVPRKHSANRPTADSPDYDPIDRSTIKQNDPAKKAAAPVKKSDYDPTLHIPPPLERPSFTPDPDPVAPAPDPAKDPAAAPKEPVKRGPPPDTTIGKLLALTLDGVEAKKFSSPYVPIGKEQWQICGGTYESAKVARWGKFLEVRWDSISPEGLYKAFKPAATKPESRLLRAEYALDNGLVEEGFEDLAQLLKEKADLKDEIDKILARSFGEAMPAGGYLYFRGDWMSADEHKILVAREKAMQTIAEMTSHPLVLEGKRVIKKDLKVLQKKAVQYINSEEYTYATQQTLDEMIAEIRKIWNTPYEYAKEKYSDWALGLRTAIDQLIAKRAGADIVDRSEVDAAIAKAFDIKEFPADGTDKGLIDHNRRVLDYNRRHWTVVNPDEVELLLRINEYRRMIGLACAVSDEMMMLAARHHSSEMLRLGYFAHQSPIGKRSGPGERCGEEGAQGGAENIARGGSVPQAFDGWYNSPPHHRNMIGGALVGAGGRESYATLLVAGGPRESPPSKGDMMMPAWLVDTRDFPIGGEIARGASLRRQYVRQRLAVMRWCLTGENIDAVRQFRASARAYQAYLVKDVRGAAGPWLGLVLEILGDLRARETLDIMLAALQLPDPWLRYAAAEALGKFAGIDDAPQVANNNNGGSGPTVANVAPMAQPAAKRVSRNLIEHLTRESHEAVCAAMMGALAELKWAEGILALKAIRTCNSWRYRYWVCKAWERQADSKDAKEQLALALNDERRAVREVAARILGFDNNPTFDQLVKESSGRKGEYMLVYYARETEWLVVANALVSSQDVEVRLHAVCGLGRMPRKEVWQVLLKSATAGKTFDEKVFAWRSMMQIDAKETRPLLMQAAEREGDQAKKARLQELLQ